MRREEESEKSGLIEEGGKKGWKGTDDMGETYPVGVSGSFVWNCCGIHGRFGPIEADIIKSSCVASKFWEQQLGGKGIITGRSYDRKYQ